MASLRFDVCRLDPKTAEFRHEIQPLALASERDIREDNGERQYFWRAVDHEGEILESFMTTKRDEKAALEFLKKAMR